MLQERKERGGLTREKGMDEKYISSKTKRKVCSWNTIGVIG
jgi:hypothetical protein